MDKKAIPNKIYLTLGGGLGDVIYDYLRGHRNWGRLKALKEWRPGVQVKAMLSTHNPQSIELIRHNPYINHIEEFGWQNDGRPLFAKHANGYSDIQQYSRVIANLPDKTPEIYLNPSDKKIANNIVSQGRFVFIHPFAGLGNRKAFKSVEKFIPIIDTLIDDSKYHVVVIGNSHNRKNAKSALMINEDFGYERDGLFNLVNKPGTNVRVAFQLAKHAHSFIGSWSCYSCTFWALKKRSIVIVPNQLQEMLSKRFKRGGRWHQRGHCRTIYTQENTSGEDVASKISNWYNSKEG